MNMSTAKRIGRWEQDSGNRLRGEWNSLPQSECQTNKSNLPPPSKRAREERAAAIEKRLATLGAQSSEQGNVKVAEADEALDRNGLAEDDEDEAAPETDADRRRVLTEAKGEGDDIGQGRETLRGLRGLYNPAQKLSSKLDPVAIPRSDNFTASSSKQSPTMTSALLHAEISTRRSEAIGLGQSRRLGLTKHSDARPLGIAVPAPIPPTTKPLSSRNEVDPWSCLVCTL